MSPSAPLRTVAGAGGMTDTSPQAQAYADFDRWLSSQSEDVQELSLLDQIELYAEDAA